MSALKTYVHHFGNGITCSFEVDPEHASGGHIRNMKWSKKPSLKLIRRYIEWVNSVNQSLADEWGKKLMHVYLVSPTTWETWVFTPGSNPEKIPQ